MAAGNSLILHCNNSKDEALELQEELRQQCVDVIVVSADLMTETGCRALVEEVRGRFSALDALVNNAGGMIERRSVAELTWEHLADSFALNTLSAMRVTALCVELLRGGNNPCVVNVTSIAMRHGAPSATAYGAAKAALDSFTRGAANELAPDIRVNAVAPGMIDTSFHDRVTPAEKMAKFVENTPLKRVGTVQEIARVVEFLLDNEFITGETIDCNGGLSMR
ncbi:SDR family oxidoreductase [Frankia sp. AgB32]|nr:SDR family oxidoreductase [Frankia sp. AgB32]